jgi:hypothetical protein
VFVNYVCIVRNVVITICPHHLLLKIAPMAMSSYSPHSSLALIIGAKNRVRSDRAVFQLLPPGIMYEHYIVI